VGDLRENRVSGRLRGQEFVGSVVTLFLELEDGSEFRIQKQEHQLAKIDAKLGEPLTASWSAAEAFLLPDAERPTKGPP
jgi:spermidine/putrescine transport system ATP-binding protein